MILDYVLILSGVLAFIVLLRVIALQRKPLRSAMYGGLKGMAALGAVNLAGIITGVSIPVSILSMGITFLCGVPGVIAILVISLIFGM